MGKKRQSKSVKEVKDKAYVVNGATVEMVGDETLRFICHFSFELPPDANDFQQLVDTVDEQITEARNEIIRKIANKFGTTIAWTS